MACRGAAEAVTLLGRKMATGFVAYWATRDHQCERGAIFVCPKDGRTAKGHLQQDKYTASMGGTCAWRMEI